MDVGDDLAAAAGRFGVAGDGGGEDAGEEDAAGVAIDGGEAVGGAGADRGVEADLDGDGLADCAGHGGDDGGAVAQVGDGVGVGVGVGGGFGVFGLGVGSFGESHGVVADLA